MCCQIGDRKQSKPAERLSSGIRASYFHSIRLAPALSHALEPFPSLAKMLMAPLPRLNWRLREHVIACTLERSGTKDKRSLRRQTTNFAFKAHWPCRSL